MTEKEYFSFISIIKGKILLNTEDVFNICIYEKKLLEDVTLLNKFIVHRSETMRSEDFENKFLLGTELFGDYRNNDRIVIGRIIFDIEAHGETEKRMDNYKKWFNNQYLKEKLFTDYRGLQNFIRDNDNEGLICFNKIEKEYVSGNHFKHNNYFYKSLIEDQVLEQLLRKDTFNVKSYPFFVKLSNTYYSTIRDNLPTLTEAEINPSNPKWTDKFSIHKGLFEGASYELLNDNSDETCKLKKAFKDSDFQKGVRRIESIAKREINGRFSMMIEELSIENNVLVGRCIHLDSNDQYGTSFFDVILNHIDYAINVYGENHDRLETKIDKKEKYDAVVRGHLFRIENYPFKQLPDLVYMLFKSKLLTEDWAMKTFDKVL